MFKPKILVIEDDPAILSLVKTTLETQDYMFRTAMNGKQGLMDILSYNPDVLVLDLGLPDISGMEIIGKIRGWSNMPIIIISARSEDEDKVEALDAGADDYLTKPFSIDEFLARVRVAIRRVKTENLHGGEASSIYENGSLKIDYVAGCVYVDGEEIHLTPMEYRLVDLLSKNTGKVLTHNYILREVWGSQLSSDIPSLRVFMATLRKKLERGNPDNKFIQTHVGIGYRMIRK